MVRITVTRTSIQNGLSMPHHHYVSIVYDLSSAVSKTFQEIMFSWRQRIVKICKRTICLFIVSWYECPRLLIASYINNNPDPSLYALVKNETFCLCGILLGHRPTVWQKYSYPRFAGQLLNAMQCMVVSPLPSNRAIVLIIQCVISTKIFSYKMHPDSISLNKT